MKLRIRRFQRDCKWGTSYLFWCPGCNEPHRYDNYDDFKEPGWDHQKYPNWILSGTPECPTFQPSLHYPSHCHLFLENGKLRFLPDSKHRLAGHSNIDCPDWPEDF